MKENRVKLKVVLLIIPALLFSFFLPLFASPNYALANGYQSDRITGNPDDMSGVTVTPSSNPNGAPRVELPNVKIEQAQDFVERKGFDVVSLIQTFAEPFTIVLFIIGGFMAVLGLFGRNGNMMKGVLVMVVAVVIYAAVIAAPELLDFGSSWLNE